MRILLVSDSFGLIDGVSRSVDTELAFFCGRGDSVDVVSTNTSLTRTYKLSAYRDFYRVFDAQPRRLARTLADRDFDVAYGHCVAPQGIFFLLYLAARYRLPMVNRFTSYAPDYMRYAYPPRSGVAARAVIRFFLTALLGVSQRRMRRVLLSIACDKMSRYLTETLRIPVWRVLENRFPLRSSPPPRTRPYRVTAADRSIRLLTAGRLSEEKNLEFLVSIWNTEIACRYPEAQWRVVGPGPMAEVVGATVAARDRVTLVGAVSHQQMLVEMVDADLMIYSSVSDTFALVITEAKLCSLPIIALADDAGVSAQVENGVCAGYLARDRTGFVSRLHNALADPSHMRKLGEAGARDIAARFSGREHERLVKILEVASLRKPSWPHRLTSLAIACVIRFVLWTLPRAFLRMFEPA